MLIQDPAPGTSHGFSILLLILTTGKRKPFAIEMSDRSVTA